LGGAGITLPQAVTELGTDAIFATLILSLTYCVGSSLLGKTPDKLPFISQAVTDRMPTVDMFTFDEQGNIMPTMEEDRKKDEKDEDEKKK